MINEGRTFLTGVTDPKNLNCKFITPLGDQVLAAFSGVEEISKVYEIELLFYSTNNSLDFSKLLKNQVTIELFSKAQNKKYVSGILQTVSQGITFRKNEKLLTQYNAILVPKLYLLGLTKHYVFYQNKNALEIIKDVLRKNNITNVSYKVNSSGKRKRETCIQYDETDLFFISRLMEEEGIFYFFKHEKGKETLVIADNNNAFIDEKTRFYTPQTQLNARKNKENRLSVLYDISVYESLMTEKYFIDDYDYNKPKTKLSNNKKNTSSKNLYGDFYSYEENYAQNKDGANIVTTRIESFEYQKSFLWIKSPTIISPGYIFEVLDHERPELNTKYVAAKVKHRFDITNHNLPVWTVTAFNKAKTKCRPPITLKKPRIYGYLSAIVTGQAKQDVFRDDLARIRIRFLWDLNGEKNKEKSSGWVRVSETFAGSNFGAVFLPRVNQEVVVIFLNGNPDRPLVIGALYNGVNKPPYKDADISCIKTQTFGDKKGFNELRFTDKKKKEEVYVHAQKDFVMFINENSTVTLKKGNYSLTLKDGNAKIDVKGKFDLHATKDISINSDKNIKLAAKQNVTISAGKDLSENATKNISVKAKTGKYTLSSTGATSISSKNKVSISSIMAMNLDSKMSMKLSAKMSLDLDSMMKLGISGKLSVAVKSNLNVNISSNVSMMIKSSVLNSIGGALIKIG